MAALWGISLQVWVDMNYKQTKGMSKNNKYEKDHPHVAVYFIWVHYFQKWDEEASYYEKRKNKCYGIMVYLFTKLCHLLT